MKKKPNLPAGRQENSDMPVIIATVMAKLRRTERFSAFDNMQVLEMVENINEQMQRLSHKAKLDLVRAQTFEEAKAKLAEHEILIEVFDSLTMDN